MLGHTAKSGLARLSDASQAGMPAYPWATGDYTAHEWVGTGLFVRGADKRVNE